jgi:hypothetical protein
VAAKAKYTYVDEFTYNGDVYRSEETDDLKGSATLLIPHVGARYYCGNSEVRPYLFGDFLKSFAFVNTTDDYSARDFVNGSLTNSASGSDELSERIKDQVQKALGFWGLSAGFGCEYAFSDHFRLGGEYALRYFHTSTKSESSSGGGAGESYSSLYNDELSASLKLSTGRVWLNYQF